MIVARRNVDLPLSRRFWVMPESLQMRVVARRVRRVSERRRCRRDAAGLDGSIRYAAAVAAMASVSVSRRRRSGRCRRLRRRRCLASSLPARSAVAVPASLGLFHPPRMLAVLGVQHLRHGITRDEVGISYAHDGGPVTGLLKALLVRLAEPFLMEDSDDPLVADGSPQAHTA